MCESNDFMIHNMSETGGNKHFHTDFLILINHHWLQDERGWSLCCLLVSLFPRSPVSLLGQREFPELGRLEIPLQHTHTECESVFLFGAEGRLLCFLSFYFHFSASSSVSPTEPAAESDNRRQENNSRMKQNVGKIK